MFRTLFMAGVALLIAPSVQAQSLGQGIERIAVDDGFPRVCLNAKTDQVSVRLDRVVVAKSKGWFSSDSAVDLVIDGKLEKHDASFVRSQAKMPVVFRANIDEYDEGTVVTPVSTVLLSKFPLSLNGSTVNLLEIDFSFINSSTPTSLSRLIARLPAAAQGLPIPPTPYTQAFVQASTVLGGVVDSIIQDDEHKEDVSREGRISLEFNDTGQCGRNGAYSGTYTFVKSFESDAQSGVVSLDDIQNHCFIKFDYTNAIFVERKNANGECTYDAAKVARLLNPHFTMIVSITNAGAVSTQNRQTLGSGLALSQTLGDGQPEGVTTGFDVTALKRAFETAGLGAPASSFVGSLYQLKNGFVSYKPNPDMFSVENFNFPESMYVAQAGVFGGIKSQPIDSKEIVLNSISRCSAFGVDVLECF